MGLPGVTVLLGSMFGSSHGFTHIGATGRLGLADVNGTLEGL
jgi:hypothetical protein